MNFFEGLRNLEKSKTKRTNSQENKPSFIYMGMPEGGRSLGEYELKMMFDRKNLEGKKVLDLGAGPNANLAKDLKESGINATVFSLSHLYADPVVVKALNGSQEVAKPVAGLISAEHGRDSSLPFGDESFDVELAFHVDEHLDRKTSLKFITEMGRTLKVGGYAKYGPVFNIPNEWNMFEVINTSEDVKKILRKYNVEISIENVPEEIIPKQKVKDSYGNAFHVPAYYIVLNRKKEVKN